MTDAVLEPASPTGPEPDARSLPSAEPAPALPVSAPAASPSALPPVSPDDPCGPDLDLEGDAEFLNFVAAAEGILPGGRRSNITSSTAPTLTFRRGDSKGARKSGPLHPQARRRHGGGPP
jgi:hypothetical protein